MIQKVDKSKSLWNITIVSLNMSIKRKCIDYPVYIIIPAPCIYEHLLQTCSMYSDERHSTWEHHVLFHDKLYRAGNLGLTAEYFKTINVNS